MQLELREITELATQSAGQPLQVERLEQAGLGERIHLLLQQGLHRCGELLQRLRIELQAFGEFTRANG